MRSALLALAICALSLVAAEKQRDWQTGQVVESKAQVDPRIHNIAGADKTYVVRGTVGDVEDALDVGATVRYAVEGTTMYLSISGKEYRLAVMGATVKRSVAPSPVAATPAAAPVKPAAAPAKVNTPAPAPPVQAVVKPAPSPSEQTVDNDAVVKMVVGGLKEDTVISVIQARRGQYVLTPDAMVALKAAGVPQSVIDAMSARMKAKR